MSDEIDIAAVSRALQRILKQSGRAILYDCRASKQTLAYATDSAASPALRNAGSRPLGEAALSGA